MSLLAAALVAAVLVGGGLIALRGAVLLAPPDRYFVDLRRSGVAWTAISLALTGLDATGTLIVAGTMAAGRLDMLAAVAGTILGLAVAGARVGGRIRLTRARSLPEAVRLAGAPAAARLFSLLLVVVEAGWTAMLAQYAWVLAGFLPGRSEVWAAAMAIWLAAVVLGGGHRGVLRTDAIAGASLLIGLGAAAAAIWLEPAVAAAPPNWETWWARATLGPQAAALAGLFAARQLLAGAAGQRWLGLREPADALRTGCWAASLTLLPAAAAVWIGVEATVAHLPNPVAPHIFLFELALRLPLVPQALLVLAVWGALGGALSSLVHAGLAAAESEWVPASWRGGRRRLAAGVLWLAFAVPCGYWTLVSTEEWFRVAEALIGAAVVPIGGILLGRTPGPVVGWSLLGAIGLGMAVPQLAGPLWPAMLASPFWPAALAGLLGEAAARLGGRWSRQR